jgi:hypothetical protein
MFGRATPDAVRLAYNEIAKPGVRVLRETITAIDPSPTCTPSATSPRRACLRPVCSPRARIVAQTLIARLRGGEPPGRHLGRGTCYIEFGQGRVGSVDIDFLSGPTRTGTFNAPSIALLAEKERFGSSRRARWFGT